MVGRTPTHKFIQVYVRKTAFHSYEQQYMQTKYHYIIYMYNETTVYSLYMSCRTQLGTYALFIRFFLPTWERFMCVCVETKILYFICVWVFFHSYVFI